MNWLLLLSLAPADSPHCWGAQLPGGMAADSYNKLCIFCEIKDFMA